MAQITTRKPLTVARCCLNPRLAFKRQMASSRRSSMVFSIHNDLRLQKSNPTTGWQGVQGGSRGCAAAHSRARRWLVNGDPVLQFLEPVKDHVDSCGYGLGFVVDHQKPVVWQEIPTLLKNREVT